MNFTVNIPYRKLIFQIRMEEAGIEKNKIDPVRAIQRQALDYQVEKEICRNQERFFLLPH